jgi:hypothetical protein
MLREILEAKKIKTEYADNCPKKAPFKVRRVLTEIAGLDIIGVDLIKVEFRNGDWDGYTVHFDEMRILFDEKWKNPNIKPDFDKPYSGMREANLLKDLPGIGEISIRHTKKFN